MAVLVLRIYSGILVVFLAQCSNDHLYKERSRQSRRTLSDGALLTKLDSIVSVLADLNARIETQDKRLAVLSRKVSDISCNKEQTKGQFSCSNKTSEVTCGP